MAAAHPFRSWLGLALAVIVALPAAAQLVRTSPPAGFADAEAPRPAVVDIWFDGARVGTANVMLAPGEIRFDDPGAVAELLPGAIDTTAVADALRGPLDTHAARLCGPGAPPDCGVLEPEIAGVIVDAAAFRVDVFVNPAYRDLAVSRPRFLPAPSWSPSAVQSFSLAASAVPEADLRYTLGGRSLLAAGPARLEAAYGVDREDGPFVETLAAHADHRRWRGTVGLARSALVPVLGDRRFAGARLATTLDTRLDRDAIRARPVTVTLARRAQVEILRDGRLLSVQTLPAGTRPLDLGPLPTGAYEVTLRIVSSAGTREERRFVVKSAALPPVDAPAVTLEAGVFADEAGAPLPTLGDTPFFHAGLRHRLGGRFGAGPNLAVTPREAVVSLEGVALFQGIEASLGVFAGTDATSGAALAARGRLGGLGYALGARRVRGDLDPGTIDTRDDDATTADRFVPGRELERVTAFAEDTTQLDLSLSWQPARGPRLGLRGFWRENGGRGETWTIGPNLFWPVLRAGRTRVDLFAEAAATDEEDFVFARLRVRFDAEPWRSWAEAGWRAVDGDADGAGPLAAAYLARDLTTDPEHRWRVAGRVEREPASTSLAGELDYAGRAGRLLLSADHEVEPGETRLAARARTTFAVAAGGLGVVGRRGEASALLVGLESPAGARAGDAVFEVVVDGRARRRLRPGEHRAVPLPAFDDYRVRLKQVAGPLTDYDGRTRRVSLYPGNVAAERWTVRPLVTVFARLVDPAGRPLADARLDTEPPAYTDAGGYFQADLGAGAPTLTARADGEACRVVLPDLAPTRSYRRLGDVPCRPVASSSP